MFLKMNSIKLGLILTVIMLIQVLMACEPEQGYEGRLIAPDRSSGVSLVVLGTVQDAGSPHAACTKSCCRDLFENPDPTRQIVALGLVDYDHKETYLFEATPDLTRQMKRLKTKANWLAEETPNGIFLTHAHIGHYSGLMFLGKEAMSADNVPVYAMPEMKSFLESNGPWSQLVEMGNIRLESLQADSTIELNDNLAITPVLVPHRDEFSETVGYKIKGPNQSALFIPDIDKWEKWERNIIEEIGKVDYAFIDGTFYDGVEIDHRDISEIPHPFIIESMQVFDSLPEQEKAKIHFIHFNHTNPVLNVDSEAAQTVLDHGFQLAKFNTAISL